MKTFQKNIAKTLIFLGLSATAGLAAAHAAVAAEDSLVCAKVRDAYTEAAYKASFWPRSAEYGEMAWCDMQVKAVEHCVPAEAVLHETDAPWVGTMGPELEREFTCYRIRCKNGEGASYLGESVVLDDTFGSRTGAAPKVVRVCLPNQ